MSPAALARITCAQRGASEGPRCVLPCGYVHGAKMYSGKIERAQRARGFPCPHAPVWCEAKKPSRGAIKNCGERRGAGLRHRPGGSRFAARVGGRRSGGGLTRRFSRAARASRPPCRSVLREFWAGGRQAGISGANLRCLLPFLNGAAAGGTRQRDRAPRLQGWRAGGAILRAFARAHAARRRCRTTGGGRTKGRRTCSGRCALFVASCD